MKNIAIINASSPINTSIGREALDTVLIYAALDQQVTYILQDKAVFAAIANQQPSVIGHKDYLDMLKMLSLYEVEHFYVRQSALNKFGVNEDTLLSHVKVISTDEYKAILNQQDMVLTF